MAWLGGDDARGWIEDLTARIGYHGLGSWLARFGQLLGAPRPFPPTVPEEFCTVSAHGIEIRLHHPTWRNACEVEADRWVLYDATIAGSLHLPFGLAAASETPESARQKLSNDVSWGSETVDGSRSVTFFLADLRVVIVYFQRGLVGIEQAKLTRLFAWPDWRRRSEP